MKSICVLCSGEDTVPDIYKLAARQVGNLIAQNEYNLIFGGSTFGMMGEVARGAYENDGKVTAITSQVFYHNTWEKCNEVIVGKDIQEAKDIMINKSDAFIFLPGGTGTLDELTRLIESKRREYHDKPIVILDIDSFFDGFLQQMDRIIELKFVNSSIKELYYLTQDPKRAIEYIVTVLNI